MFLSGTGLLGVAFQGDVASVWSEFETVGVILKVLIFGGGGGFNPWYLTSFDLAISLLRFGDGTL